MRPLWKTAAVVGACAACCAAPLAIVPLAASLGFAAAGLAFASEIGTALALVAAAVGLYLWQRRKTRRACACAPDAGCTIGASRDIPTPADTGNDR